MNKKPMIIEGTDLSRPVWIRLKDGVLLRGYYRKDDKWISLTRGEVKSVLDWGYIGKKKS